MSKTRMLYLTETLRWIHADPQCAFLLKAGIKVISAEVPRAYRYAKSELCNYCASYLIEKKD